MTDSRQLRFGGPGLPDGTHTWFYDLDQPSVGRAVGEGVTSVETYAQVIARPGDVVAASRVQNAEDYVARGQAEFILPGTPPSTPPPRPKDTAQSKD